MAHIYKSLLCLMICVGYLFSNSAIAEVWRVEAYNVGERINYYYYNLDAMSDDASMTKFYDLPDFLTVDTEELCISGIATEGGIYTFRIEIFDDGEFVSFECTLYVADSIWSESIATSDPAGVFVESETTVLWVGWDGDVMRTTDGVNWLAAPSIPGMVAARAAAYMDGTFVVMGGGGVLAYSNDEGDSWALADLPDLEWMHLLQVLNGEFVVLSDVPHRDASLVFKSVDGMNWTSHTIDVGRVSACRFMGGQYYINTHPGGISFSDDLIEWSALTLEGTEYASAFGELPDGQLLIIGSDEKVWKSDGDGEWTLVHTLEHGSRDLLETPQGIYFGNSGWLQFTTDGSNWSFLERSEVWTNHFFYSPRLELFFVSNDDGIRRSVEAWGPQIIAPEVYVTESLFVGEYFEYQVETNGNATSYYVFHLPDGLNLNEATGLIYGTPTAANNYDDIIIGVEHPNGYSPAARLNMQVSRAEGDPVSYREFSAFEVDADLPQRVGLPMVEAFNVTASQLDGFPTSMDVSNLMLKGSLDAGVSSGTLTVENQYGTAVLPLRVVSTVRDWRSIHSVWASDGTNINYGDGRLYATTRHNRFISSEDGIQWEEGFMPPYVFGGIDDATGFGSYTYVITEIGAIYRSQTRSDWELVQDGWYSWVYSESNWIRNVNSRLFAAHFKDSEFRTFSALRTSIDGETWTTLDLEVEDYFTDITHESGLYVLVGQEHILTSVDGINWELLHDDAPGESLEHFNASSSVCVTNGGFIVTMEYSNKAFYIDALEPELMPIIHDGFEVHAPWAIIRRDDTLYARDVLGNELHSTDGITWTMLTEIPTSERGWGSKNQVFAAAGVELWNNPGEYYVQLHQATNLPQLATEGVIAAHVHDIFRHSLDLSPDATIELIEDLPGGLIYDADQKLIQGTFTQSGYFGATVVLRNEYGLNYFLLRFEVLPALPVVTVSDTIVAVEEYGDAYFAVVVESESDYQITWKKVSSTYATYYETVFDAPFDITRLRYVSSFNAGLWHAKVTNAGGSVYSDPIELIMREPYRDWDVSRLKGKFGKEIGWQQTNLERYALGLKTEVDKVRLPKLQADGASKFFEFSLSQLAQDLVVGVQYSTDLVKWNGGDEIVIEQVSEDLERIHYKAYLDTPSDCVFYRLYIRDTTASDDSSGSSVGTVPMLPN